jgi:hypothetical protein
MGEIKKTKKLSGKRAFIALTGVIIFFALLVVLSIFVFKPIEFKKWGNIPFADLVEENQEEIANEKAAEEIINEKASDAGTN